MRSALRKPLAVVFGVLLVTASALGSVAVLNDDVRTLGDASDEMVQRGQGQVALGAGILVGAAAYYTYDNYIKNSPNTNDLQKIDANETRKEIYDQASIQEENNDQTLTALQNYLQDTESIALMEGKSAYIRALENGSSEVDARAAAFEAVEDYYTVKEKNLIASWETSAIVMNSSYQTVKNTSGVADSYVLVNETDGGHKSGGSNSGGEFMELQNVSMTLTNGTSTNVTTFYINYDQGGYNIGGANPTPATGDIDGEYRYTVDGPVSTTYQGVGFQAPTSDFSDMYVLDFSEYKTQWDEIQTQNSEVKSQVDSFINNTYDSYEQGTINTTDLVDPYLGARDYDPETSSTWTLRTLSSMGIDPPENLSNIGRMNVTADGYTYTGTLMSDGKPSGGYVVGGTYDANNITGLQFIATDDGQTVEIEGEFTLESVTTADGEQLAENETVVYEDVNYNTSNTSEFKALQSELDELTAQINAKQQEERNSGGTGWLPKGMNLAQVAPVAAIAAGALVLLGRE